MSMVLIGKILNGTFNEAKKSFKELNLQAKEKYHL